MWLTRAPAATRATRLTFQYFAVPAVTNLTGTAHDGTATLPSTPPETFVSGRKAGKGKKQLPAGSFPPGQLCWLIQLRTRLVTWSSTPT